MTDQQFINQHRRNLINFKTGNGLPVGDYLIIIQGYYVYNRKLKIPLINSPFHSIIDAYKFCQKLEEVYGDLLHILIDKDYAEIFFQLTRYTVENGIEIKNKICSLDTLSKIRRADLLFLD